MSSGAEVRLELPPPPTSRLGSEALRDEFKRRMDQLQAGISDAIQTFGLEQKAVAWCARTAEGHDLLDMKIGRGPHVAADPRRLIGRLSFEPVVVSYWGHFASDSLTDAHVRNLGRVLGGARGVARLSDVRAGSDAGYQRFAPPPPPSWALDLLQAARAHEDPITSAIVVLGSTIVSHPLQDGNGRLGRALFWSRLALLGGIPGPFAPLGFTTSQNPAYVAQASLQLGKMGSWAAFADRYLEIMNYSMDLTSRMTDAGLLGQAAPATGFARKEP